MKKKMLAILLMAGFLIVPPAWAVEKSPFVVHLNTSATDQNAVSGCTGAGSGTSTLYVYGPSGKLQDANTIGGLINTEGKACLQIEAMSNLTNSGTTFTIYMKESLVNAAAHWTASGTSNLFTSTAWSGVTLIQVYFEPKAMGFMRLYLTHGAYGFQGFKARVVFK